MFFFVSARFGKNEWNCAPKLVSIGCSDFPTVSAKGCVALTATLPFQLWDPYSMRFYHSLSFWGFDYGRLENTGTVCRHPWMNTSFPLTWLLSRKFRFTNSSTTPLPLVTFIAVLSFVCAHFSKTPLEMFRFLSSLNGFNPKIVKAYPYLQTFRD